ncbi:MAG: glycosyltransferase [Pseudomonadota bacterium]|nr:glycosyltransferase [Pseudomonadota bacterium]
MTHLNPAPRPPMRLMQILLSQAEAGAETYFEKVAAAFARQPGIEQQLVIEALPAREARLTAAGVDYRSLPMGLLSRPLFYDLRLKQAVRDFRPDLIVTWVNRASRKCPRTDAVVVGRLGGYYDINNYRKCDHLIVNTPDLVRHVTEHGWEPERVSMISNFGELPDTLQTPQPLPEIPPTHKVLLALGRLHPKKAHDTLIKAMPEIPNATLLIAGNGSLQSKLQQLAQDLGVADRVQLLGLRKDVFNLFQRADICVFPSRFEPLGNVVLEAWATATPIVAAASQGPSWLITDEEDGLLFPVDDVAACARQVNRLIQEPALGQTLAEHGQRRFQREFSMEVIIGQYRQLFSTLVEQHRSDSPCA